MEGVLVSARKTGSTVTTTVVSDREGRYRFRAPGSNRVSTRSASGRSGTSSTRAVTVSIRGQHAVDRGSEAAESERPRVPAHERGMAREHARHRRAEGVRARVRALPHAGAGDPIAARCQSVRAGHRTDGRVPAARVPVDAAKDSRSADRRRCGAGRAATAGPAASGRVSQQHQSELGCRPVELRLQDAARVRTATRRASSTRNTTCRNEPDSRTTSSSIPQEWPGTRASANRSSASSIRRRQRSPNTRCRC